MKVLIVASNREKIPIPVAPIGACHIASVLAAAGHEVEFIDLMWERKPLAALERCLNSTAPELVALSLRNLDNTSWMNQRWYLDDARALVAVVRRVCAAPVLVGGPAVGVLPGPVTAYIDADWGIWGDGERSATDFVAALEAGANPSDVAGVVTPDRSGAGQHRVNPQYRVQDMGEIPSHRMWEWLDFRPYLRHAAPLQVQSRRGCAFECSYCNYPLIEGGRYRRKPPAQVAQEIAVMHEQLPSAAIEFVDNTFNVPLRYCLELLDEVIALDLDLVLHTAGFNPKATSTELMHKMDRAGFAQVMITPEVAHEGMLLNLQKGFTMAHLRRAVEHRRWLSTQASKMEWMWVFLLGGPGETQESIGETFRFIREEVPPRDPVFVQVGLRVYPGTPLQQQVVAEGGLRASDELLEPFHYVSPALQPMWIYDTLMAEIDARPNITTLRDVMNPAFPYYLRVASLLGLKAPITSAQPMVKLLSKLGRRAVGPM